MSTKQHPCDAMSAQQTLSDSDSSTDGWELINAHTSNSSSDESSSQSSGSEFIKLDNTEKSHSQSDNNSEHNQGENSGMMRPEAAPSDCQSGCQEQSSCQSCSEPLVTAIPHPDIDTDHVCRSDEEKETNVTLDAGNESESKSKNKSESECQLQNVVDDVILPSDDVILPCEGGIEEVYAVLRERLSARMSRESSSESEASDFVRLDHRSTGRDRRSTGSWSMRSDRATDGMQSSGSSISSRFSFIQHINRDEDESLPESDISLLNEDEDRSREESLMSMRPTSHPHYTHNNNNKLNFYLNIIVSLVLALALGLGIGHAIGSSREMSAQRDIRQEHVQRINSLQDNLLTCMARMEERTTWKISSYEKRVLDDVVREVDEGIHDLETGNLVLTNNLDEKSVNSLLSQKRLLLSELEKLQIIISGSSETSSNQNVHKPDNSQLENDVENARQRIQRLESKRQNEEKVSRKDYSNLRIDVTNVRLENERLRHRVDELQSATSGGDLVKRMGDLEEKNVDLVKKCEEMKRKVRPDILEEIAKVKEELKQEKSFSRLWSDLLSFNSTLPFLYQHLRDVINSTTGLPPSDIYQHLRDVINSTTGLPPNDIYQNLQRVYNSTQVQQIWAKTLNTSQWAAELALNNSKDMVGKIKDVVDSQINSSRGEIPHYIVKTKETMNLLNDKIKETWSKLKNFSFNKDEVKEGARKMKDKMKSIGQRLSDRLRTFTHRIKHKFNKYKNYNTNSKKENEKRREKSENKFSDKYKNGKFTKNSHSGGDDKNRAKDDFKRKKMDAKLSKMWSRMMDFSRKVWEGMDNDDVEDVYEDLMELIKYFHRIGFVVTPWLNCQRQWWLFAYKGTKFDVSKCPNDLFPWQRDMVKENDISTDMDDSNENSTDDTTADWYFKNLRESDANGDWFFKKRQEQESDSDWFFKKRQEQDAGSDWFFKKRQEQETGSDWLFKRAESRESLHKNAHLEFEKMNSDWRKSARGCGNYDWDRYITPDWMKVEKEGFTERYGDDWDNMDWEGY